MFTGYSDCSQYYEVSFLAHSVGIPSLQLGTGKTAAVRVSGPLVGKSCRMSRICPPSVGAAPAALSIYARLAPRYVAQL